jgi:hypothetical protein
VRERPRRKLPAVCQLLQMSETPWTSGLRDDAPLFRGMWTGQSTATQAQLYASPQQRGARKCKALWALRHHGVSRASEADGAKKQSCDEVCIEGKGRTAPPPPSTSQVGIKQAAVRAQRRLDAARMRGYYQLGRLARQGGWAVLKFCWRGFSALQQSMPECACMHACLHTQSPRHPRHLSHSRSLAPSLSPSPLDMRR